MDVVCNNRSYLIPLVAIKESWFHIDPVADGILSRYYSIKVLAIRFIVEFCYLQFISILVWAESVRQWPNDVAIILGMISLSPPPSFFLTGLSAHWRNHPDLAV